MSILIFIICVSCFAFAMMCKGGWLQILAGKDSENQWRILRLERWLKRERNEAVEKIKSLWQAKKYSNLPKACFELIYKALFEWVVDGSIISCFVIFITVLLTTQSIDTATYFTLAWVLILSSMGEEAGAAGDYKGGWGPYIELKDNQGNVKLGRNYGLKKGVQYGAFGCGAMALVMEGAWPLWIAGVSFPLVYYIGTSAKTFITGRRDWAWAEPLWGAVIGLAYYFSL